MDFRYHFEKAWEVFTRHLVPLVVLTLMLLLISAATFGILAPVLFAGYMQALLLAKREQRPPEIRDLFGCMHLFLPLLGFSVLVSFVFFLGLAAAVIPAFLLVILITFFCLYMLPLMIDRDMKIVDAIKESARLGLQEPVSDHLVILIVYWGLVSLGSSIFLGILFTQPYATLFLLSAYEAKVKKSLPGPGPTPPPPPPGA